MPFLQGYGNTEWSRIGQIFINPMNRESEPTLPVKMRHTIPTGRSVN